MENRKCIFKQKACMHTVLVEKKEKIDSFFTIKCPPGEET